MAYIQNILGTEEFKLQNETAISLVNVNSNSLELAGSSSVLIDKFIDRNGYNNIVDTGNTDAIYDTTDFFFECNISTASESTVNGTASYTGNSSAIYFKAKIECYLTRFNMKSVNSGNGTLSLKINGITVYSNNIGAYTANQEISIIENFHLYTNDEVEIGLSGTSNIPAYVSGVPTYPSNIYMEDAGSKDGLAYRTAFDYFKFEDIADATYIDSIIQSSAITIPSGKTKVFCTPLFYEELDTGDSITWDISIDGGSTETTSISSNEWTEITSSTGTSLITKMNLNTNNGTTTPKILGWRVLVE